MPRFPSMRRRVTGALAASAVSVVVTAGVIVSPSGGSAAPGATSSALAVGTWNTDLEPWLPNQSDVIDTIAASRFDVLGLQGVWSDAAATAIATDPRIAAHYPYHYTPAPRPENGICPDYVPRDTLVDFVNGVTNAGLDPRQLEQPTMDIPFSIRLMAINISFISQPCFATLVNTLQNLPTDADPLSAIDLAYAGQGPMFAHGGSTGELILSDRPIQDVSTTYFDTYQLRRANVYATVAGVRIAFAAWPRNVLEDFNPDLGPLQVGELQPALALDVINNAPDLVVGSFNSGRVDSQSAATDLLGGNGFRPQFGEPTYCPSATHADYPPCRDARSFYTQPTGTTIDDVYAGSGTRCANPAAFATVPASDHIGASAVCAVAATVARPAVTAVSPAAGPGSGGQQITITGSGFTAADRVVFGATRTTDFTVDSDTQLTVRTPPHGDGVVQVRVHTLGGLSAKAAAGRYRYRVS